MTTDKSANEPQSSISVSGSKEAILAASGSEHEGYLPSHLGIELCHIGEGVVEMQLVLAQHHMALNGYMHAGAVVTLADTACGYGAMAHLPEGAESFTTIELKSNHLGTARSGKVCCTATLVHGGRSTQVWDAKVYAADSAKTLALFRCTQMILWPRRA